MLHSLRLQNFRCFESLSLELESGGGIFVGNNAQGKTSILEAVCVLLRLSSPRAKRLQPMVQFDHAGFGIAGEAGEDDEFSLKVNFSKGKAVMSVDGEELSTQSAYLQNSGLVVWMGNEDVELVKGSGGVRRHYLDFLCSQINPRYRVALSRYRKVLKARNLLLKDGGNRDQEVRAFGELLIEYGDVLHVVRDEVVRGLMPRAAAVQVAISGLDEVLGMDYVSGCGGNMRQALEMTYESERRQRQTLAGPHRDEVKLTINGMAASDYASEGQQRTMALALKLAQGEILHERGGKCPIYLLDDIFGELDPTRRNALMGHLPEGSQKLITTTNVDWLSEELGLDSWSRYEVTAGKVY